MIDEKVAMTGEEEEPNLILQLPVWTWNEL